MTSIGQLVMVIYKIESFSPKLMKQFIFKMLLIEFSYTIEKYYKQTRIFEKTSLLFFPNFKSKGAKT